MKPEIKIKIGLGTAIFLLVTLSFPFVADLCRGFILSASIGLLAICVFLVYLKGMIKKDVQLAKNAFRTLFILSMIASAIVIFWLPSAYTDHVIGINGLIIWCICLGANILALILLKIGIIGLIEYPNSINKSTKVKVLWWAYFPFIIAAILTLLWIFEPLLRLILRRIFG